MENRIKELRKTLGLSQQKLGEKIGVSKVTINKIENGKTVPNLKLANDISLALGESIGEVFYLKDKKV